MTYYLKNILRPGIILFASISLLVSCTTQAEEDEYVGTYHLLSGDQQIEETVLTIAQNRTFTTNCSRFNCENGTWDVSTFPTALGVVITFYKEEGVFCEQLHWKKGEETQVLESQETEEQYVRRYQRANDSMN